MDPAAIGTAFIWVWGLVFFGVVLYRLKTRRSHIGSAGAGTIYDIVQEEKRRAIEIVVADKAAAKDFEHADDDDPPTAERREAAHARTKLSAPTRAQRERA